MSIKRKSWRNVLLAFLAVITVFIGIFFFANFYIPQKSITYISKSIEDLPQSQAALILGARVYDNGKMSDVLLDRTIKGLDLYKAGKVSKLLISGDHGQKEYDEVNAVKDYLLQKGVNKKDIFTDHAGFDTYDSLYRAKEIFEVESVIVVTQEFHLPRAVYIGNSLGITTYGYVADRQPYLAAKWNETRESLARVKAFIDVLFHSKPKYLGDKIDIKGDGTRSWD